MCLLLFGFETLQEVAVFVFDKKVVDKYQKFEKDQIIESLKKGVQQLTRLRHPRLLTVQHPLEESRWILHTHKKTKGRFNESELKERGLTLEVKNCITNLFVGLCVCVCEQKLSWSKASVAWSLNYACPLWAKQGWGCLVPVFSFYQPVFVKLAPLAAPNSKTLLSVRFFCFHSCYESWVCSRRNQHLTCSCWQSHWCFGCVCPSATAWRSVLSRCSPVCPTWWATGTTCPAPCPTTSRSTNSMMSRPSTACYRWECTRVWSHILKMFTNTDQLTCK